MIEYFEEAPSPLASRPLSYDETTIDRLLERLRPYDLTKAEIIMILNLRPTKPEILNTMVEELETRFDEEQQMDMARIITEVLGKPNTEAEKMALQEDAEHARRQGGAGSGGGSRRGGEAMDVDA